MIAIELIYVTSWSSVRKTRMTSAVSSVLNACWDCLTTSSLYSAMQFIAYWSLHVNRFDISSVTQYNHEIPPDPVDQAPHKTLYYA